MYHNHLTSQMDGTKRFIICISNCKIPVNFTVNTESRRKVKISCALTVKLCTCVRLIKSDSTCYFKNLPEKVSLEYNEKQSQENTGSGSIRAYEANTQKFPGHMAFKTLFPTAAIFS